MDPVKYLPSALRQFSTSVSRRERHQELLWPYCLLHLPAEWAACGCIAAAILLSYSHRFQACCVQEQPWGKRIIGRLFQISWTQIIEGLKDRHLRRNLIIISELPGSDTILRGWATRNLTVKLEVAHGYILLRNINSIIME